MLAVATSVRLVAGVFGLVLVGSGCGRLGFDPTASSGTDAAITVVGALDRGFNGRGVLTYDYVDDDLTSKDDRATAVALDSQGRIVASASGTYNYLAAGDHLDMATITLRILEDGTPDPLYQSGALSSPGTTVDVGAPWSHGTDLIVGANDDVTVCGFREWGGTDDPTLYRYQAVAGQPSPSLGGTGTINISLAGEVRCQGFAVDPTDGDYVVVGESSTGSMFVAKVRSSNGTLVPSFGGTGTVIFDVAGSDAAFDVVVDRLGRIYVVGATTPATSDITVWRYLPGGTLDPSFSGDGIFRYDTGNSEVALAAALAPGEDLVVVGYGGATGATTAITLQIDQATGELDPLFGTAGRFAYRVVSDTANGVVIDGAGAIYVTGATSLQSTGPASAMAVWKLTPDGALDESFGSSGLFTATEGSGGLVHVGWDLVIDRAGRLVVVGESMAPSGFFDVALWRIL